MLKLMKIAMRVPWALMRGWKVWKLLVSLTKSCSRHRLDAKHGRRGFERSGVVIVTRSAGRGVLGLQWQAASLWTALAIRCRMVWLRARERKRGLRKVLEAEPCLDHSSVAAKARVRLPARGESREMRQRRSHSPTVKMRHWRGARREIWSRCGPPAARRASAVPDRD